MSILFSQLVELEAIDTNPVRDISKEKIVTNLRTLLTTDQRKKIDEHFAKIDPGYQRFLHIFFHSGARPKELLCIKKEDVNLENQTYKITVIKGKYKREELRPIKNVALPYWQDIVNKATIGQYLFGRTLQPGDKPTTRDYITKKWQREVKDKNKLNIQADLYSLKHSNLDETAAELSLKEASMMAGHTSTVITMKHYAIGEKERQNNRLKEVNNKFA
ncbi:MAG: tyrosine-type recombinase/integrase [Chitinophagaceae bacterium]|nr:tyrosine-type recombinase/integrase [Chitinophagaceae bacterium]